MDNSYESIIADRAKNQTDEMLPNSTLEHAYFGLKYLIQTATSKIKVVSNQFYDGCWERLYPFLIAFLGKKDATMEIVILDSYKKDGILAKIKKEFPDQIKIFQFDDKNAGKKVAHFVVINPMGYRFEFSDEEKENKIVKGVINFGDKLKTESLNAAFENIKSASILGAVGA